jgi:AcrR family transcriptional regulator
LEVCVPPRIAHSVESVINAAVEVVRREGGSALTARNVAAVLGASTQPIYRSFGSMDDLAEEVANRAYRIAMSYTREAEDPESAFLAIGLGYLRFSRAEPQLFDFLMTTRRSAWSPMTSNWPVYELVDKMRGDAILRDLPDAVLRRLLRDMFIYTHGLAALAPSAPMEAEQVQERELLRYVGGRLMGMAVLETTGELDLDSLARRFHGEEGEETS